MPKTLLVILCTRQLSVFSIIHLCRPFEVYLLWFCSLPCHSPERICMISGKWKNVRLENQYLGTKAVNLNRKKSQSLRIFPSNIFFVTNIHHFFYRTTTFEDYNAIWPSHTPCSLGGKRAMKYTIRPNELDSEHGWLSELGSRWSSITD